MASHVSTHSDAHGDYPSDTLKLFQAFWVHALRSLRGRRLTTTNELPTKMGTEVPTRCLASVNIRARLLHFVLLDRSGSLSLRQGSFVSSTGVGKVTWLRTLGHERR